MTEYAKLCGKTLAPSIRLSVRVRIQYLLLVWAQETCPKLLRGSAGLNLRRAGLQTQVIVSIFDYVCRMRALQTLTNFFETHNRKPSVLTESGNGPAYVNKVCETRWRAIQSVSYHDRVVTLAMIWGNGIWHFPAELLGSLAVFKSLGGIDENTMVHVFESNLYVKQWLGLFGISESQIIDGAVFAEKLIVLEGSRCGNPAPVHLTALRNRLLDTIQRTSPSVILIKRTKDPQQKHARGGALKNHEHLEQKVREYAQAAGLQFYLHDASSLPSVRAQLEHFASARVIVGPHGAGMVDLLATPKAATVIEYHKPHHRTINLCYARLSSLLEMDYHALPAPNDVADILVLDQALPPPHTISNIFPNGNVATPREQYYNESLQVIRSSFCRPEGFPSMCEWNRLARTCLSESNMRMECPQPQEIEKQVQAASLAEATAAKQQCVQQDYQPCKFYSTQHEDSVMFSMFFQSRRGGMFIEMGGAAKNTIFY